MSMRRPPEESGRIPESPRRPSKLQEVSRSSSQGVPGRPKKPWMVQKAFTYKKKEEFIAILQGVRLIRVGTAY